MEVNHAVGQETGRSSNVDRHARRRSDKKARPCPEEFDLGEHKILESSPLECGLWDLHLQSRKEPEKVKHVVAIKGQMTSVTKGVVVHLYSILTNLSIVHKVI